MLRYDRQTKPGLVALYDIQPGNGAGPFLQPRSPHGAFKRSGLDLGLGFRVGVGDEDELGLWLWFRVKRSAPICILRECTHLLSPF